MRVYPYLLRGIHLSVSVYCVYGVAALLFLTLSQIDTNNYRFQVSKIISRMALLGSNFLCNKISCKQFFKEITAAVQGGGTEKST
jgi:hypothetical protein